MGGGTVPNIALPKIRRVTPGKRDHETIAGHFGDYRRAGDAVARCVAAYDGAMLDFQRPDRETVDQYVIWNDTQLADGATNRESARVVDVQPIDLANGSGAKSNTDRAGDDLGGQLATFSSAHGFGIRDTVDRSCIGIHYDSACDNGARERAPSDFVNSSQKEPASGA